MLILLYYLTCKTLLTFFVHAHCGNQLLLTMLAWLNKVYHHHHHPYSASNAYLLCLLYTFINKFHNKQFISATNKIFNIQERCNFVNFDHILTFSVQNQCEAGLSLWRADAWTRVDASVRHVFGKRNSRHLTREIRDHR